MTLDFEKLIQDCDSSIRTGEDQKVVRVLVDLDSVKIPRKYRLPLATLCRRVALISTGLKILAPAVSPANGNGSSAEIAEYAALLQKFGAIDDALRLLKTVNEAEVPEALMYRAICHFARWEYEESIPLLTKYIAKASSPYQALIGRVNLSAALVNTDRLSEAGKLLISNAEFAHENKFARLEGNCQELLTQVHLLNRNFSAARKCLERAEFLLVGPKSLDRLYTNKCRAFLTSLETKSINPLLTFRNDALTWPHAETVREVDLYSLIIKMDDKIHDQLYFGTPFEFYKKRMERLLGVTNQKTQFIVGNQDHSILDISTGENSSGPSVKTGTTVHKVLNSLLRDFYRPSRFGNLFGQLYPDEHFDIHSSPARVHQCLRRTRLWLSENNIGAEIVEFEGSYSLRINGQIGFKLSADRNTTTRENTIIEKLHGAFPNEITFTAAEAREKLQLTNSSFHRFIKQALEVGSIQKYGASTSTVYFIPASISKAG